MAIKYKEIFYRIHSESFGDTLASTPTLRRLYYAYSDTINIVTKNKKVFKNNPYIKSLYSFDEFNNLIIENTDYEIFDSFTNTGRKDERGIEKKFSMIDIRQIHSFDLGFQLTPEQMSYDYYPDPPSDEILHILSQIIDEEYVVLHVTSNWDNRTWDYKNWEKVIEWLSEKKILTITIGMDHKEYTHSSIGNYILKECPTFNKIYGHQLINKGSMNDMWHIINHAKCIITSDSGPLHLAGTTDTHIIQLGSAIDWRFRAPYRKGSQEYRFHYAGGHCKIFCNSDLYYNVNTWGTINAVPPMIGCKANKSFFECHPSSKKVISIIEKIIS